MIIELQAAIYHPFPRIVVAAAGRSQEANLITAF
jgi:hypothetical protein